MVAFVASSLIGLGLFGAIFFFGSRRDADATLTLDQAIWADLYAGTLSAADAEASGGLGITGDRAGLARFSAAFDHPYLSAAFATDGG